MNNDPSQQPSQPQYPYQHYQQPPQQPISPYTGEQYNPAWGTHLQPPYQQPQVPKKSRKGLWITLGIIAILLFACIWISVAVTNSAKGVVTTDTSNTTSSSNTVAKVGQTITLDGVEATLTSVNTHEGTEFDKPKAGNEYVIVHVKIHNTGSTEQQYNAFEFHVKSGAGNITDEEIVSFTNSSDELNSGTLAAGGTAEGDLVFQVEQQDSKAELTWQPSFFGQQGENGWLLGL